MPDFHERYAAAADRLRRRAIAHLRNGSDPNQAEYDRLMNLWEIALNHRDRHINRDAVGLAVRWHRAYHRICKRWASFTENTPREVIERTQREGRLACKGMMDVFYQEGAENV